MLSLTGLSAFPITPADADGRVDIPALRRLVARLRMAGVDSIGLLGSTGTYPYLTRAERRRALEAALAEAGDVPVLVGVGALRTDESVALARDARAAGAAAGLLAAMAYIPLTEDEVVEHYAAVAEGGSLPLCIYDNPSTTHTTIGAPLLGRLARIPGVVAAKCPAPAPAEVAAYLSARRAMLPDGFALGCSGDWNATAALIAGAGAWYSVIAGLLPELALPILRAVRRGDASEAQRLDGRLQPVWDLFRAHSSLRVVYAAADLLDLCHAVPPRPILPLGAGPRREVAEALRKIGLL